jgi:hypothetical protein
MIARSDPWPITDVMMMTAIIVLLGVLGFKAVTSYGATISFLPEPRQMLVLDATTALDASEPCTSTLLSPTVERHVIIGPSPYQPRVVELWYRCDSGDAHAFIWSVDSADR